MRLPMLALALSSAVAAAGPSPRPLKWDPRVDLPVVGVTLAAWVSSEFVFKAQLAPAACHWCVPNAFDTAVRRVFNPALTPSAFGVAGPDTASNVLLGLVPASMLGLDALLAWRDGTVGGLGADLTVIAEAVLVSICLNQAVKFFVGRARPYTIGASAAQLDVPGKADHDLSFFSGHTTFVFAAVAATATVAQLRGYRLGWLAWAIGVPLATTTAVLRLAADKHWASDVLVGLAVGAGVGVGLPLLFHRGADEGEGGPRLTLAPAPGGVALAGTF